MSRCVDDRNSEQRTTHRYIISARDRFMSGWGGASGGASVAAWACEYRDREKVLAWVRSRDEMSWVRLTLDVPPRRRNVAHEHVYVVDAGHPALD